MFDSIRMKKMLAFSKESQRFVHDHCSRLMLFGFQVLSRLPLEITGHATGPYTCNRLRERVFFQDGCPPVVHGFLSKT